jgi:alpha-D-ribose 1-methylphosphonate 5-triphosphate synthase subunit PhnH
MPIPPDLLRQQANFRILLKAMSRPGEVFQLAALPADAAVSPALMAVAECLLDGEVTFAAVPEQAGWELRRTLQTATGCRPAAVANADFIFVLGAASQGKASRARRGRPEFPDEGATLVYLVASWDPKEAVSPPLRLKGPGIAEENGRPPAMAGLSMAELRELSRINVDYPLGVDAFFVQADGLVMGLPRSTAIIME